MGCHVTYASEAEIIGSDWRLRFETPFEEISAEGRSQRRVTDQ
jgi:hypothetical protein